MLSLAPSVRIFVARRPVDFRKGFDGLCAIVRDHLRDDPLSGQWYLFFNRGGDRLKILFWDRNGFWLFYKRLERGRFERIEGSGARVEIDRARLAMLLDGMELRTSRIRQHFVPEVRIVSRSNGDTRRPPR
jgi:transposase